MPKNLTIMLMSGEAENEDALFAGRLAEAVLKRGDKVHIFLYGNGVNVSKKDSFIEGDLHISETLLSHIESRRAGKQFEKVIAMGARVSTCHTNEHARGIQALEYRNGIQPGDIGHTFCDYLLVSNVFLVLKH